MTPTTTPLLAAISRGLHTDSTYHLYQWTPTGWQLIKR
jgi:hypothetical protein